jgi:hypothetical protein
MYVYVLPTFYNKFQFWLKSGSNNNNNNNRRFTRALARGSDYVRNRQGGISPDIHKVKGQILENGLEL